MAAVDGEAIEESAANATFIEHSEVDESAGHTADVHQPTDEQIEDSTADTTPMCNPLESLPATNAIKTLRKSSRKHHRPSKLPINSCHDDDRCTVDAEAGLVENALVQKVEPLLQQICYTVDQLNSRQQRMENQLSMALGLDAYISDTPGACHRASNEGFPPSWRPGDTPSLDKSEISKTPSTKMQHHDSNISQSGVPKTARRGSAKAITHTTNGSVDGHGRIYVRISVQAPGESEWRCPAQKSKTSVCIGMPDTACDATHKGEQFAGRVMVHLICAKELRNADVFGKSDPYCVCAVGTGSEVVEQFHTRVISDTLEPGWNEEHIFEEFNNCDMLHFSVKDKNLHVNDHEKDDVLGICSLHYDQIFPDGFSGPIELCDPTSAKYIALEDNRDDEDETNWEANKLLLQLRKRTTIAEQRQLQQDERGLASLTFLKHRFPTESVLNGVMAGVILLNAFILGISLDSEYSGFFVVVDMLFLFSYIMEMLLKLQLHGISGYFASTWNCFDCLIIIIDIAQLIMSSLIKSSLTDKTPRASIFRMLRLARLLRLGRMLMTFSKVKTMEDMLAMIGGIMGAIPTLIPALLLFLLVVYVVSLMFREFFGRSPLVMTCEECGDADITEYFNSVPRAMLTVFRYFFGDFTTIQGVNIYEALHSEYGALTIGFVCVTFFIVFISVFNVITAIFVERTLAAAGKLENHRLTERLQDPELWTSRITILLRKLYEKHGLDLDDGSNLPKTLKELQHKPVVEEEFALFIEDETVLAALKDLEIDAADHNYLFQILDADNTGSLTISEFIDGLYRLRGAPRRSDVIRIDLMVREVQHQVHEIFQGMEYVMTHISPEATV